MLKNSITELAPRSEGQYGYFYEDEENKIDGNHEKKEETDSVSDSQREASDRPVNTSDEEQEELPYDGSLDSRFYRGADDWNLWDPADTAEDFPDLSSLEFNESSRRESTFEKQDIKHKLICGVEYSRSSNTSPRTNMIPSHKESTLPTENLSPEVFPTEACLTHFPNSRIPDVLLRHFPQDLKLNSGQFIDSETLPDTSFAESSDETIISRLSHSKGDFMRQEAEHFESFHLKRAASSFETDSNVESLRTYDDITAGEVENSTNHPKRMDEGFTQEREDGKFDSQKHFETIEKESNYGEYKFERRTSSQELKYGQGPVHYRLPDFSKVPPKVKIPKKSGGTKAFPGIKRAKSSPNLIGRSSVVKDILEAMPCGVPAVTTELEQETAEEMSRLQAFSNWDSYKPTLGVHSRAVDAQPEGFASMNSFRPSSGTREERPPLETRGLRNETEGERMSATLREQTEQLKIKVLQHLKGCLETLEHNYLSTKEKHRHLQLQNSNSSADRIGVFDPDRLVESEIFKLGMLLEDVKERIDNAMYNPSSSLSSVPPDLSALPSPKNVESKREESHKEIPLNEDPDTDKTMAATLEEEQNSLTDSHHQPSTYINENMECKNVTTVPAVKKNTDNAPLCERTPSPDELACSTSTAINRETGRSKTDVKALDEDSHQIQNSPESHDEASWTDTADVASKTESLDSAQLPDKTPAAKELQDHVALSGTKGETDNRDTHKKPLDQDTAFGQDGRKGCFSFLDASIKTCGSYNWGHHTVILNVMDEGRGFTKALDSCSQRGIDLLDAFPKKYISNAQLAQKEKNEQSSTVCRTRNTSDATFCNRHSKQRRIEIVIKGEAANLDRTETDDHTNAHTRLAEHYAACKNRTYFSNFFLSCARSKNHISTNDPKSVIGRIQAYSPRRTIYAANAQPSKYKSDLGHRTFKSYSKDLTGAGLPFHRKNFATPKIYYSSIYDTVRLSPQYITRGMYRKKTLFNTDHSHLGNVDSMILNSILDQAIQTAKSMKKTTERMVQTVSADLAKAQSQRRLHKALLSSHALS